MERLLDKLMNPEGSRIWILNRKYCPHKAMLDQGATVVYSYDPVGTEPPLPTAYKNKIQNSNEQNPE